MLYTPAAGDVGGGETELTKGLLPHCGSQGPTGTDLHTNTDKMDLPMECKPPATPREDQQCDASKARGSLKILQFFRGIVRTVPGPQAVTRQPHL